MVSKALSLAKLLGDNNKLSTDTFGDDVSTIEQASSTDVLTNLGNAVGDQRLVGSNLYIWNGTGWYRIALINQTPTWDSGGQPLSLYALDADSPQDTTIITLAASDPDGLPISYSYVTSGSMDSMATISQDSSVFTITPKTVTEVGEGAELTGSITFRASDGVNILPSVSSFTLSFITRLENSRYTTLLATAVDTSDNNNITDSSTSNHTITVTGDAHAGTFSPYRHGGYSTYFDGNGDYIDVGSAIVPTAYDTDYTIEMWIYPTTTGSREDIFNQYASSASGRMAININTDATISFFQNGLSPAETKSSAISANNWYHLAVVNSSGTRSFYVNGSLIGTATGTVSMYSGNTEIGRLGDVASNYFTGYITDVRVVNGTAVYTGSFTPPTDHLTAVANTSLLTCHLPYITDGSSSPQSITVNGNTSTKPFTPYDNLEYAATDHGGSVFFDGTGDYLIINDTNIANFGTGDFTIEAWVYCNDTTTSQIVDTRPGSTNGAYVTIAVGNSIGASFYTQTSEIFPGGVGTINVGQWHHVAWVRNSGTISVYVDGTSVGSASNSTNFISSNVGIGWNAWLGESTGSIYISDLRIVKGTAVYTGNFTPPTFPLSSSGTSLHLKGTDASIIDKSQTSNLKLVGNTTGSTTQVKFANTKSMYFDGDADEIAYTVPTLSGDFTFEAFIYPESQIQTFPNCFIPVWDTTSGNRIVLLYDSSSYVDKFSCRVGSNFIVPSSTSSTGQWYHVAVVRSGSAVSMYIDGIQIGTQTYSGSISSRTGYIGGNISNGTNGAFKGYIQDFRVTNGLARYTSNFTPPTKPLEG